MVTAPAPRTRLLWAGPRFLDSGGGRETRRGTRVHMSAPRPWPSVSVLRGQWTRLWRKQRRRSGGEAAAPDAPRGGEAAGHRGADALTSRLPGAAHRDVKNVRTRKNPRLCSLKGKFTFASPAGIRIVQSRALASGKGLGGPAQRVNGPDAHAVISGARQSNMSPQTCAETPLFLLCGSLDRGTNFEQSGQQSVLFPASWFAAT